MSVDSSCSLVHQLCARLLASVESTTDTSSMQDHSRKNEIRGVFLQLKQLHRNLNLQTEEIKKKTIQKKASVDELAIALQTLAYEKAHLVKEIKVCKEFTEPKVKMVQEQLFEEHARSTKFDNNHEKHLARLSFEIESRKQLVSLTENKITELASLKALIREKKQLLCSLVGRVETIYSSVAPLASLLPISVPKPTFSPNLCPALHILHQSAVIYSSAFSSQNNLKVFVRQISDEEPMFSPNPSPSPVSPTSTPFWAAPSVTSPTKNLHFYAFALVLVVEDLELVFRAVDFSNESGESNSGKTGLVTLTYEPIGLLTDLEPNDNGIDEVFGMFNLLVDSDVLQQWRYNSHGMIYKWVQRQCGISSALDTSSLDEQSRLVNFTDLISKIQDRVRVRKEISNSIYLMEKFQFPFPITYVPVSKLTKFQRISWEEFLAVKPLNNVNGLGWETYRCEVIRKDVELVGLIAIPPSYPKEAPIFELMFSKNVGKFTDIAIALNEMQYELNCYSSTIISELFPESTLSSTMIFAALVYKLLICLDILAESENKGSGGFSTLGIDRAVRGRDRRRPFKMENGKCAQR